MLHTHPSCHKLTAARQQNRRDNQKNTSRYACMHARRLLSIISMYGQWRCCQYYAIHIHPGNGCVWLSTRQQAFFFVDSFYYSHPCEVPNQAGNHKKSKTVRVTHLPSLNVDPHDDEIYTQPAPPVLPGRRKPNVLRPEFVGVAGPLIVRPGNIR